MVNKQNYVGQTFEYWEVVGQNGSVLTCRCKCGTVKDIPLNKLISGRTKSCRACTFIRKYDNIKGSVFGNYKVVSDAYRNAVWGSKHIFVSCECLLCGHIQEVPVSSLIRDKRGSCRNCAAKLNLIKANEVKDNHKYDNDYQQNTHHKPRTPVATVTSSAARASACRAVQQIE